MFSMFLVLSGDDDILLRRNSKGQLTEWVWNKQPVNRSKSFYGFKVFVFTRIRIATTANPLTLYTF